MTSYSKSRELILALYCLLIFTLSHQPTLPMPPLSIPLMDKWIHGAAYAVMGWLAWRSWHQHYAACSALYIAALFCSIYGISDEWHQSFVPGRNADPFDWLADTIGGTAGAIIAYRWSRSHPV
ncbi:MAG: VanZ family protein [Mariprofundales bacterium]|nr:VanZ family protein [Mariprofundales bacterium]